MTQFDYYLLLILARFADLFTTWLVSPDLKLEGNPLVRRLGWKRVIALNILVCATVPLWHLFALVLSALSFLCAAYNLYLFWWLKNNY